MSRALTSGEPRGAVRPGHAVVRAGTVLALRFDLRALRVLAALLVATAVAAVASVSVGEFPLAPGEVLAALAGVGEDAVRFIVLDLRAPRVLAAVLAGVALGVAGAIFQDVAGNPLVAPDIIGISSGAALAAVAMIVFGDEAGLSIPLAALAGALVTGAALYLLAWRRGVEGYRLVLVGIGLTALLNAGISYVLTRGRIFDVTQAYVWLVGSLNGRGWEHVRPLALALVALIPAALVLARSLQALQLGDELARALGVGVERARLGLLLIAVLLTGVAVSVAGAIAFVAFIAPHIARRLARSVSPPAVMAVAGVAGGLLVTVADLAGRMLFAPTEIPVGIVTAILAAPYFLYLLRRSHRLGAMA